MYKMSRRNGLVIPLRLSSNSMYNAYDDLFYSSLFKFDSAYCSCSFDSPRIGLLAVVSMRMFRTRWPGKKFELEIVSCP